MASAKTRQQYQSILCVVSKNAPEYVMMCTPQRVRFFRFIFRYPMFLLTFAVLICLLYKYYQLYGKILLDFPKLLTSKTRIINTSLRTAEDVTKVLVKANGFLAATRTSRGKISTASAVCVVDPALLDCNGMGFAAFLLETFDRIMLCSALGNNQPVVYWRSCYSACSSDPKVNSWDWYFEPVNRELESQVDRVLCPVLPAAEEEKLFQGRPDLRPIWGNSFKSPTKAVGFEDGEIITTEVRMRINALI